MYFKSDIMALKYGFEVQEMKAVWLSTGMSGSVFNRDTMTQDVDDICLVVWYCEYHPLLNDDCFALLCLLSDPKTKIRCKKMFHKEFSTCSKRDYIRRISASEK